MKNDAAIDIFKTVINNLLELNGTPANSSRNREFQFPYDLMAKNKKVDDPYETDLEEYEDYDIPEEEVEQEAEAPKGKMEEVVTLSNSNASSNPQGVIDSIASELTSARLKQAIILSEIVGKPKSKTRRKRRQY
ncbi:MAG: hypothetical protein ACRC2K_04825 [Clostridium sp.]